MKRLVGSVLVLVGLLGTAPSVWAGSPHFVGDPVFTVGGSVVTVAAKEAGLGDEAQIHVVLSGDAQCRNPGGNDPAAANKQTFSVAADEPAQNGHSDYSLTLVATFQPSCSPPMSVVWSNVRLTDTTNGLTFP